MSEQYADGYLQGLKDTAWKCFDCGNIYESLVDACPNKMIDEAEARLRYEKNRVDDE